MRIARVGTNGAEHTKIKLEHDGAISEDGEYTYHAKIISSSPATDFTARIISCYEDIL
ncbi:MAG TPA: hypothetical protein VIH86_05440 [Puia sp.]